MLKLGKLNINNAYLGRTGVQKMYLGADLVWGGEEPDCYAIADTLAEYTGDYPWLWVESESRWYRRNEQNTYEPYGVYVNSIEPFRYDEEPLLEARFAAESYYVTNKNASGNTRMVIDFTTPDAWGTGTQFLCGTRTGTTATNMTNVGYTNAGRLRIDAGSNTFATDTYDLTLGTRYILDYRTYGTNLRWILSTPDGTVLRDFSTTFSGSQVSNYPFCINTMNQGGTPLAVYAREGSKIRNVKFYSIDSVNDEGTLTNDYEFYGDRCIDLISGNKPTKYGTVTFAETGEKYLIPMGETTYKGKLAIVDGVGYEWDGSAWKEVESKTYTACTAILDGDSYFTTDATVGVMRKYSMVYKPDYDDAATVMGVIGNAENRNRQSFYMEKGNQLVAAVGSKYPVLASSSVFKNNTWTKVDATTVYNDSTTVKFDGNYSTGSTFNGQFTSLNTVTNSTGQITDNPSQFIKVGGITYGSSTPLKGEFHSVKIDYDTTKRTTANWQPYHNFVFIDVDGEIKLFDTVTNKIYNQEGDGVATVGTVYGSVTAYKTYESKEAPENPMVFDTVAEMEAYGCVFEGMLAVVDGDKYIYTNGQWEEKVILDIKLGGSFAKIAEDNDYTTYGWKSAQASYSGNITITNNTSRTIEIAIPLRMYAVTVRNGMTMNAYIKNSKSELQWSFHTDSSTAKQEVTSTQNYVLNSGDYVYISSGSGWNVSSEVKVLNSLIQ